MAVFLGRRDIILSVRVAGNDVMCSDGSAAPNVSGRRSAKGQALMK
ncbi:MAG: hypothetical protein R6V44_14085 [Paracoccaceae bacterium]